MNLSPIEEVALTQQLVRINSTNPGEFEYELADFIADWLSKTGAEITAIRSRTDAATSLPASKERSAVPRSSTSATWILSLSATAGIMSRLRRRS